jgi:hypothetical protein
LLACSTRAEAEALLSMFCFIFHVLYCSFSFGIVLSVAILLSYLFFCLSCRYDEQSGKV